MGDAGESYPAWGRAIWRRLEVIHAVTYFAPSAAASFREAGYRGFWMGYFAGRSAPLGAVGPEVVQATFYNFAAERVAKALPDAWSFAAPDVALDARLAGAVAALTDAWADVSIDDVAEAAALARRAAEAAPLDGRTLFAANAGLPWPEGPVAELWHAATLLREHRGDGHVALLTGLGITGRESNIFQVAAGNVDRAMIERARDYDADEWSAIERGLAARGLMTDGGSLTEAGARLREELERRTDELASVSYEALDPDDIDRLLARLDLLARAVASSGQIPARTPMGPTLGVAEDPNG